jgi:hypothetical protein
MYVFHPAQGEKVTHGILSYNLLIQAGYPALGDLPILKGHRRKYHEIPQGEIS